MKVSLYLYPVVEGPDGLSAVWKRFAEQFAAARRAGFDGVWIPEHHVAKAFFPPVNQVLTWCGAKWPGAYLGTAVALPALHHPLRLAEEIAALHGLSGGRFRWGVGYGFRPREFRSVGAPIDGKIGLARDVVRTTVALLRGESCSFAIGPWQAENASLSITLTEAPEVLWGVRSRAGVRAIASQGTGILPGMLEGHTKQLMLLEEFDRAHGQTAATRPLLTDLVVAGASGSSAEERALRRLSAEYGSFRHHRSVTPAVDAFAQAPEREYDRLRDIAVVGGVDEIRSFIQRSERSGVSELVVRVEQARTAPAEAIEAIEALGEAAASR